MKKFTKSLAVILSALMLLSCFTAVTFISSADTYFTEWTTFGSPCCHVAKADATTADSNYPNYQYTGQCFIPKVATLNGISVGFLLTGGNATVRISVFEGDNPALPGAESSDAKLVVTQDFAFNPGAYANQSRLFDFNFTNPITVTPGATYCFTFYFVTRDAGSVALCYQSTTSGNPSCFTKSMTDTTWLKHTGFTKPFKLIEPPTGGLDKQVHSLDNGVGCVVAAGNQQNIKITGKRLEGTGAYYSDWGGATTGANQKMYLSLIGLTSAADCTGCDTVSFDLYCHGWHYNNVGGTDTMIKFGTGSAWGSSEIGGARNVIKAASANIKEGWNHIVLQAKKDDGTVLDLAGLNVIGLVYEKSIVIDQADAYVIFDDFRVYNAKGLEEDYDAMVEWKNVVSKIDALPEAAVITQAAAADVVAARTAYDALTKDQQANVWNITKLADCEYALAPEIDKQVHSLDNGNNIVVAAGNTSNFSITSNHLEGSGAWSSDWDGATGNTQKLYISVMNFGSTVDCTGCDTIAFDMYCKGWNWKTAGGDSILRLGSGNTWNSEDLGGGRAQIKAAFGKVVPGWNHVVIPCKRDDGSLIDLSDLNVIGLVFEQSINVTSSTAYVIFDDFRVYNSKGYGENYADMIEWKDNIIEIMNLPDPDEVTTSDLPAIQAARENFDALDADQQAKVWNVKKLEDCEKALTYVITIGSQAGVVGNNVTVPVTINSVKDGDFGALNFTLNYDETKLEYVSYAIGSAYDDVEVVSSYNAKENLFGLAATDGLTEGEDAEIVKFTFKILEEIEDEQGTEISISDITAANVELEPLEELCEVEPGYVTTPATTYAISYDANGGDTTPDTQIKSEDVAIQLADAITKKSIAIVGAKVNFDGNGGTPSEDYIALTASDNFEFTNWTATDGTEYDAGASYTKNESTTMTAQWEKTTQCSTITLPGASREGFAFQGWLDEDGEYVGTEGDEYTPEQPCTLTADWKAEQHNLTINYYYAGTTEEIAPQYVKGYDEGAAYSVQSPVIADYTPDKATISGTMGTTDIVETVYYTFNKALLVWNPDGGRIVSKSGTYTEAGYVTKGATLVAPTLVKKGYWFVGWEPEVPATMPETDSVYKAVWEKIIYGDVDFNKTINATDALLTLQSAVNKKNFTAKQKIVGDVDGNGIINSTDALLILQYSVGKIKIFPVEKEINTVRVGWTYTPNYYVELFTPTTFNATAGKYTVVTKAYLADTEPHPTQGDQYISYSQLRNGSTAYSVVKREDRKYFADYAASPVFGDDNYNYSYQLVSEVIEVPFDQEVSVALVVKGYFNSEFVYFGTEVYNEAGELVATVDAADVPMTAANQMNSDGTGGSKICDSFKPFKASPVQ